MKHSLIILLCMGIMACSSNGQKKVTLSTQQDSISYAIGQSVAKNLKSQGLEVNVDIVTQAMRDFLVDSTSVLTDEQISTNMTTLQQTMMEKQQQKMAVEGETNKKEGDEFLAANKTKPGVTTTSSGLQYKVVTMGTGPKPKATETVTVHYRGTTIDGKEFDSSIKRGEPATFGLNQVIKGWTEGLQLMPVGSKFEFYIPSELAYGPNGPGEIGSNRTLIFEVELLSIGEGK